MAWLTWLAYLASALYHLPHPSRLLWIQCPSLHDIIFSQKNVRKECGIKIGESEWKVKQNNSKKNIYNQRIYIDRLILIAKAMPSTVISHCIHENGIFCTLFFVCLMKMKTRLNKAIIYWSGNFGTFFNKDKAQKGNM